MERNVARALRMFATPLLAVAVVGCSSKAVYPGDRVSDTAVIMVNNTNTVLSQMTVHLIAPGGERKRLGNVNLNESRSFTIRRANLSGTYRLLAEPLGHREITSHSFALSEGDAVEWNLRQNFVQYRGSLKGG
jgi:hypothetical protein